MIYPRDALSTVVGNIRIPTPTSGVEEVGTGVFVTRGTECYFVTAAHVVRNINDQSYIVLSHSDGTPHRILTKDLLGTTTFDIHPKADLAKVRIALTPGNTPHLQNRCFPYDQIDTSDNLISKDTELTTIGFPNGLGANGAKFAPLTFRTFVSGQALSFPRFDNKVVCDFVVLELPATGGYSGGPVFDLGYVISGAMTTTKEKTILHGIVHGTITDQTGGKLAAVTPCKYLEGWF
jgi:S1-C subfamily serine protease